LLISDWSRWALKGHKGFKLTQDELKRGIDAQILIRGLRKNDGGKWVWLDDYAIKQEEVAAVIIPPSPVLQVNVAALSPSTTQHVAATTPPSEKAHPNGVPPAAPEPPPLSEPAPTPANEKPCSVPSHTPPTPEILKETPSSEVGYIGIQSTTAEFKFQAPSDHTAKQPSPFVEKVSERHAFVINTHSFGSSILLSAV
jgi:hypothetical protein